MPVSPSQRCADFSLRSDAAHCQSVSNAEHGIPYKDRLFGSEESLDSNRPEPTLRQSDRAACDQDSSISVRSNGAQYDRSLINELVITRRSTVAIPPSRGHNPAPEIASLHPRPCPAAKPSSCSTALREGNMDIRARAFSCPLEFCQRPFRRLEHLKRHVRTHTRERPYLCGQCGRSFSRQDNLLQHIRTHLRNGRGDSPPRPRLSSGSTTPCDAAALPRSASEWPRQNYAETSPGCDPQRHSEIANSVSGTLGGQISRSDRLFTAPPAWA
jgi:hypothetical protein